MSVTCEIRWDPTHSSTKRLENTYKKIVRAHLAGDVELNDYEMKDYKLEEFENIAYESESYISFPRATVAIWMAPKKTIWIVKGALIDTGSNILSSVGLPLLPTMKIAIVRNTASLNVKFRNKLENWFNSLDFRDFLILLQNERKKDVKLNIVPGTSPIIISQENLDDT